MRKLCCCILFLLYFITNGNTQTITIEYLYHPTEYFTDSFLFPLNKTNRPSLGKNEWEEVNPVSVSYSKEAGYSKTTLSYNIKDTSSVIVGDLFGHSLILLPDTDTLKIIFGKKLETENCRYSKDSFLMPWQYRFTYISKYHDIYQLRDSLDMTVGSPVVDRIHGKLLRDSGSAYYFIKCRDRYNMQLSYLNQYCYNHKIPESIKDLQREEIKCRFIINLLDYFLGLGKRYKSYSDLPPGYIDSLNTFDYNNERHFYKTRLYALALVRYVYSYLSIVNGNLKMNETKNIYNVGRNYLRGVIRDFFLPVLLEPHAKDFGNMYDSLLTDFKSVSSDNVSIKYLDSIRANFKRIKNNPLLGILYTKVVNVKGEEVVFKTCFEDKPVVIDCWASWCKPCIAEMPYTDTLKRKYGDKVEFVYLSFDKMKESWLQTNKELRLKNSFLLPKNFTSDLAYYYNIKSIPRYIILDKNKNVISPDSPRPSDDKEISKVLDGLLK